MCCCLSPSGARLERWLGAAAGRILVAAHCGAQTTADTVALATHAAEAGADAVAVIGPPYFKLDPVEQRSHLLAAARACAPLPFYVYEFAETAATRSTGRCWRASATTRTTSRG